MLLFVDKYPTTKFEYLRLGVESFESIMLAGTPAADLICQLLCVSNSKCHLIRKMGDHHLSKTTSQEEKMIAKTRPITDMPDHYSELKNSKKP